MPTDELFIPRKTFPDPSKTSEPEIAKWQKAVSDHIRTNNLAVQRWANTQPLSASVQGNSTVVPAATGALLTFDSTYYDPGNMVKLNPNNRIVLPQPGIYLVTCTITWNIASEPIGTERELILHLYVNGTDTTPIRVSHAGWDSLVNSGPVQSFAFQLKGIEADYLQVFAGGILTNDEAAFVTEFTVTLIGRVPSTVQ